MSQTFQMVARTLHGLEDVLSVELETLGATNTEKLHRAVSFEGDMKTLYRVNYCSRMAISVLKPIKKFEADHEQQLYDAVYDYPWEKLINPDGSLFITPICNSQIFTHSLYAAQKTKDAIVDRLRQKFNTRPYVTNENPDIHLNLRIWENQVTLSLDSSGESLHRRGYRQRVGAAPINEILAAGMIQLSGWDGQSNFFDPMCGSGTLLIEAAMYAMKIPSQYYRKQFAFTKWIDFSDEEWKAVRLQADEQICDFDYEIWGSDISGQAIKIAEENIRFAKLHKDIQLFRNSIEHQELPEGETLIITNPPYGERIVPEDLYDLYHLIGSTFKHQYQGNTAWVISSDKRAVHQIGLKATQKFSLYNGALVCQFLRYDLYEGSKKAKKQELTEDSTEE